MKFTIITVTLNSERTIRDTLNSVLSQNYKNYEHLIIDGGSTDETLSILKKYKRSKVKIFLKKDYGIYKSINYAIKKSTGDYIHILNSDDIFFSNHILSNLKKIIEKNKKTQIFLGNVSYFKNNDYHNIKRIYKADKFKTWKMKYGLMPPHPGSFISKKIYARYGLYNSKFKIAGDFDFFLRIFFINNLKFKILKFEAVKMRLGGISGKSIYSYWISTKEIIYSFKINNIKTNIINIMIRIPAKAHQIIFLKKKISSQRFVLFKILFDKKYYLNTSLKIVKKLSPSFLKSNFVLSGLNLAFLGYFVNQKISLHHDLYHWPDGVWAKRHINIRKIPGRELLDNLRLSKTIKKITVLGNLTFRSKNYLIKKFKLKINNISLPYGNIKKIISKKIHLPKNTLTLITLPTPKQEQLALKLIEYNKDYKIICIGASIALASGEEKRVPKILKNYEYIWRLRTDFFRRLKRILETLMFYINGKYFKKSFINLRFLEFEK